MINKITIEGVLDSTDSYFVLIKQNGSVLRWDANPENGIARFSSYEGAKEFCIRNGVRFDEVDCG